MTIPLVLPEGFSFPPLPYLLVLAAGLAAVGVGATRRDPTIDERHVLAFVPWILAGSCVHALYVVRALPPAVEPLGGTPAVYATVAVVGGLAWLAADATFPEETTPRVLGVAGIAVFVLAFGAGIAVGLARGSLSPLWPAVALVVGLVVGAATWWLLGRAAPHVRAAGAVGALAIVGHAIDGVSTAVGIDVLGFGERTPLSRVIIDLGSRLPIADVIGAGWLFVVVKLVVVSVVVVLLSDLVREDPREGSLLLGFVAAVGLGPGAHNLLLFTIA